MSLDALYIKNDDEKIIKKVLEIVLPKTSDVGNHFLYGKGNTIEVNPDDSPYEQCFEALDHIYTNFENLCTELGKANIKFFIFGDSDSDNPFKLLYMGCNDGYMSYTTDDGLINIIDAEGIFSKYKMSEESEAILTDPKIYDKIEESLEGTNFDFYDISSFPAPSLRDTYLKDQAKNGITFTDEECLAFKEYCDTIGGWAKDYTDHFSYGDISKDFAKSYDLVAHYL